MNRHLRYLGVLLLGIVGAGCAVWFIFSSLEAGFNRDRERARIRDRSMWMERCALTARTRGVSQDEAVAHCTREFNWIEQQRATGWRQ